MSLNVEKIIREYIRKSPHMSLATVSDNKPWVCEVHFVYDDDLNLYFVSKQATRHCREIAINPNVAGNIIKQHPLTESPNGVYFEGQAKKIEATASDIGRYCDALGRDAVELTEQLREADGRSMYQIQIANWAVFGNFDGNGTVKSELSWSQT